MSSVALAKEDDPPPRRRPLRPRPILPRLVRASLPAQVLAPPRSFPPRKPSYRLSPSAAAVFSAGAAAPRGRRRGPPAPPIWVRASRLQAVCSLFVQGRSRVAETHGDSARRGLSHFRRTPARFSAGCDSMRHPEGVLHARRLRRGAMAIRATAGPARRSGHPGPSGRIGAIVAGKQCRAIQSNSCTNRTPQVRCRGPIRRLTMRNRRLRCRDRDALLPRSGARGRPRRPWSGPVSGSGGGIGSMVEPFLTAGVRPRGGAGRPAPGGQSVCTVRKPSNCGCPR